MDIDPNNWHPLGRVFPAELGPTRDRAAAARTRLDVARDHEREGRGDPAELAEAEREWAAASVAFRREAAKVGEFARVMLECLAATDPAALIDILDRAGLTEAAARLAVIESTAAGLTRDIETMRQELDSYRAKTWGAFQLLNKLEAHADRIRYDLEQLEGKSAPRKPKAAWQTI